MVREKLGDEVLSTRPNTLSKGYWHIEIKLINERIKL